MRIHYMGQVRNRTKIYKHFSAAISSDSSRNTIVQCAILFCRRVTYASRSLQKQRFLALDVPLNATNEDSRFRRGKQLDCKLLPGVARLSGTRLIVAAVNCRTS